MTDITTRLNAIRQREDAADARKTRNVIAILCGAAAFGYVVALWSMVQQ